jgi:hypothetical protein
MLLAGVLGLARSRATAGRVARLGLGVAAAGWIMLVAGEAAYGMGSPVGEPLLGGAGTVAGVGMVLVGVAMLRGGRWRGPARFTPLACGLYIFVVLLPAFALFGMPNYWAIAGWPLCWLFLGIALLQEPAIVTADRQDSAQLVAGTIRTSR